MEGKYTCPTCRTCTGPHTFPHPTLESFRLKDFVCSPSLLRVLSGGARNTPLYSFPFSADSPVAFMEAIVRGHGRAAEVKVVPAKSLDLNESTYFVIEKIEWRKASHTACIWRFYWNPSYAGNVLAEGGQQSFFQLRLTKGANICKKGALPHHPLSRPVQSSASLKWYVCFSILF